jgi:hypothetical protein
MVTTQRGEQAFSRAGEPTSTPMVRIGLVVLSRCRWVAGMAHSRHPAADNIYGSRWGP